MGASFKAEIILMRNQLLSVLNCKARIFCFVFLYLFCMKETAMLLDEKEVIFY